MDDQWLKGELYGSVGVFKASCCIPSKEAPPKLSNNTVVADPKSAKKDNKKVIYCVIQFKIQEKATSVDEEIDRLRKQGIDRQYDGK